MRSKQDHLILLVCKLHPSSKVCRSPFTKHTFQKDPHAILAGQAPAVHLASSVCQSEQCSLSSANRWTFGCGSKPMVPAWVGAPPILVYFSGDWDVHWGYGTLTHGPLTKARSNRIRNQATGSPGAARNQLHTPAGKRGR